MATVTTYYPGSKYPGQYSPPISWASDYNPSLGDLWDDLSYTLIGTPTPTQRLYQLDNGLKLKLIGTGLRVDSHGDAAGGILTGVQILQNNGTTLVHSVTGLNAAFELFSGFAAMGYGWDLARWLLNGNDVLNGSAGDDELFGHGGNDTINAGAGDDFLVGGAGKDTYNGGVGLDQISFDHDNYDPRIVRGISVNAQTRTVIDNWGNSESFTGIESFRGSAFADSFVGSAANEEFVGMGGRDVINGAGGIDLVTYFRDERRPGGNHGVSINLTTGVAIDGFAKQDTLLNIEEIWATKFGDALTGSAAVNTIWAEGGNDTINGLAGDDWLYGEDDKDTMTGGAGNDTFAYYRSSHSVVGANADVITDFDDSGDDKIDLVDVFDGKLVYRHNAAFAAAGQVRINDIAGVDLLVEVNTGGSLAADMQIRLVNTTLASMAANDFFL